MIKIFLGVLFLLGVECAASETEEDIVTAKPIMASPTDVVSGPSFPNPEDFPQNGIVVPPSAQKKAKKIACCLCLMSPCLCMWGCFNAVTSRLNRMTCGCLYEAFPCLDFD